MCIFAISKIIIVDKKVTYWIEMSDYDLETAKAMLATGRYLYVGFMCHQTIEKILKAFWSKNREGTPLKIHFQIGRKDRIRRTTF